MGAWAADGAHEYETVGLLRAARWNSTFSRDGVSIFGAGSDNEDLHLWVDGRGVHASWFKMASTLSDDTAPSASLDHLEAQAAPTHPGAQPEPLGSLPWPQELASGRPKVEEFPLSTTRKWLRQQHEVLDRMMPWKRALAMQATPFSLPPVASQVSGRS